MGITASQCPLTERKRKEADLIGEAYRIGTIQTARRAIPGITFDTNHWKSFAADRLNTPQGARGSLSVFGDSPALHRMYGDHMASEFHVRMRNEKTGRAVDEWKETPARDNDWWDTIVGSCVAAHKLGSRLLDDVNPVKRKKMNVIF